jgi:hypothetical protein
VTATGGYYPNLATINPVYILIDGHHAADQATRKK